MVRNNENKNPIVIDKQIKPVPMEKKNEEIKMTVAVYDERFANSIRNSEGLNETQSQQNQYLNKSNQKYENVKIKQKGENKVPFKEVTNQKGN